MSQILGEGTGVSIVAPHGLQEIRATFGDIFQCVLPDHTLDPRWENDSWCAPSCRLQSRSPGTNREPSAR